MSINPIVLQVLLGVDHSGVLKGADKGKRARVARIIEAELKSLFSGEEYADERAALRAGKVGSDTVLHYLTLSCVLKIKDAERKAALPEKGLQQSVIAFCTRKLTRRGRRMQMRIKMIDGPDPDGKGSGPARWPTSTTTTRSPPSRKPKPSTS